MVPMSNKKRTALITLCVIAVLIVAAVVAVRLLLTRERLLAMVMPRVERAVDARVRIGDIGIRFPFGFGVDITDLAFEKTLPDSSSVAFSSGTVTVRAGLMSLIRRKPEIKAADIRSGSLDVYNPKQNMELALRGIESRFSMRPGTSEFSMNAQVLLDSVLVAKRGGPPAVLLEKITFDGEMTSDLDFTKLVINESNVGWNNLVTAKVKGTVTDLKTRPRVAVTIESAEKPLAPILEKAKSFKFGGLSPAGSAGSQRPPVAVAVSGGEVSIRANVEGFAKEPPTLNVSFQVVARDVALTVGEIGSVGKLSADIRGEGGALAWTGLFPTPTKPMTPQQIAAAWNAVKLDGTVKVADASFVMQPGAAQAGADAGPSLRVSSLTAVAEISGGDVKSLSGGFLVGSSPYTYSATLLGVMPASAELLSIVQNLPSTGAGQPIADFGPFLDRIVNVPTITANLKGRSFDARPYEKPLFGKKEAAVSPASPAAQPSQSPAPGGPGAILLLKRTTFSAKVDSLIAREAVLTGLSAQGTIRDGRIKVDPATFDYAGGKGKAIVNADVRKPARVETNVEFSMENVEAGTALGRLSPLGSLVEGRFTVKTNAQLAAGPAIDPLMTLTAAGSALSSKGTLTLGSFLASLGKIEGFDITPFNKFDYREWTGSFLVKEGRFYADNWTINSTRGIWDVKGSFGFDGSLDYAVRVVLPPDVQAQMKDLAKNKQAFDLLRDAGGNLILDIHIGGTAKHPSASLDLAKVKSKVQEKLIDDARRKLQQLLKK
jgi:hypothetical protein